jgi:protein SCO1
MSIVHKLLFVAAFAFGSGARADSTILNIRGIDESDQPASVSDWRGKNIVLTMAYSECRRVCATTLKLLNDIQREATAKGNAIEIIVVSLDPKTDSPETWRNYRDMHDLHFTNWHFLTADQANTTRLANQLGLEYWRYDEHVMHSLRIVRISRDGMIAASLDWQNRDVGAFLAGISK